MPRMRFNNESEISSCIIAQVKFELGITKNIPSNTKICSNKYWNEVADIIASRYPDIDAHTLNLIKR